MNSNDIIGAGAAAAAVIRTRPAAERELSLRLEIAKAPGDAVPFVRLAEFVARQGRTSEATAILRSALDIDPSRHDARLFLARILRDQGQPKAAIEEVETLPPKVRDSFDVCTFEAALLGILGRHGPEIALYEKLIAAHPDHPALWKSFGDALKYAGRGDDSAWALRQAVMRQPDYGEGWWSLANLKSARFSNREIAAMRKSLRTGAAPDDALHLHFALGKALEERSLYAESFLHYDNGNRLRASVLSPSQLSVSPLVDELIATFDAELMARVGTVGHASDEPIFVLGLQRSGSTLIEQILASHPLIEGTSELLTMQQLWVEVASEARANGRTVKQHLLALSPEQFAAIGEAYLERTRPFRQEGRPRFVDKLPANWMQVGFIRLVLPNARIIDARRHPMACGFSNFKQHYASGVTFAYSQESIGGFYRDYLRMMRHLRDLDAGAAHLAINERFIENTETEVRALLDFVKVPFDPACLASHRTARAVNTPSAEQVRRPINRDGMNYWRHYETWLGPLEASLGAALEDWTT